MFKASSLCTPHEEFPGIYTLQALSQFAGKYET